MTGGDQRACGSADASPRELLEALPAAVVVIGPDSRVRYANRRATATLGASSRALVGRSVDDVLGAPCEPERAGPERSERVIRTSNGSPRRVGYSEARVGAETAVVFRDITTFALLRRERDKLLSLAAIGEALPSLLHELKNPLAAVTTSVEVLIEELPDGETREHLHAILSELRRMKLGFEGVGAVHGELRSRRLHAVDLACREACRVLEARARNAGVRFRCDIPDLPLLPLDPSVVRAIILNFVTNAVHACDRAGAVRVIVRLTGAPEHFEITVSDIGAGMAPEVLERATELFFTTKASGSGIGLALCRQVLEGAGGSLELRSVPGFGTSVRARVPIENEEGTWEESNR